jgi:hypothetical protein
MVRLKQPALFVRTAMRVVLADAVVVFHATESADASFAFWTVGRIGLACITARRWITGDVNRGCSAPTRQLDRLGSVGISVTRLREIRRVRLVCRICLIVTPHDAKQNNGKRE